MNASALADRGAGLVLIGARGSGKTTVGRRVAADLDRAFIDLDQVIEQTSGMTIPRIFELEGERGFREREAQALEQTVLEAPGSILATGGGAVLAPANRSLLVRHGLVVWLTAEITTLASRIEGQAGGLARRPALTEKGVLAELDQVLEARRGLYAELADHVLDTETLRPDDVGREILDLLANRRTSPGGPPRS